MGGEDFAYVLERIPGAMAFLGVAPGGGDPLARAPLHNPRMNVEELKAEAARMEQENRTLRQQVEERYGLENIIGESAALHEGLQLVQQFL